MNCTPIIRLCLDLGSIEVIDTRLNPGGCGYTVHDHLPACLALATPLLGQIICQNGHQGNEVRIPGHLSPTELALHQDTELLQDPSISFPDVALTWRFIGDASLNKQAELQQPVFQANAIISTSSNLVLRHHKKDMVQTPKSRTGKGLCIQVDNPSKSKHEIRQKYESNKVGIINQGTLLRQQQS